jgi:hypothetical protein
MQGQINGMYYHFTSFQIMAAVAVLLVLIVVAVGLYAEHRKKRTAALKNRFGSEYDRAVLKHGSASEAENKLANRTTRVDTFEIRELGVTERERLINDWHTVQSRFVDHPKLAVIEADDLINGLLEARGYPVANFEQRAADVSVGYPRIMGSYRLAHDVAVRNGSVDATTEELRTAMIQYRGIFDELIQVRNSHPVAVAA